MEEIDEEIPPKTTSEFTRKPTTLPTMDGFVPGENEVTLQEGETGYF